MPHKLVDKIVDIFTEDKSIFRLLEPCCGDGRFIDAVLSRKILSASSRSADTAKSLTAIEIDEHAAQELSDKMKDADNINVLNMDFFSYYQENKDKKRFDLILGNPPYIRCQYLSDEQRNMMSQILISHGMKSNKLINTWVGFMVACVHMLSDDGKIAFVIPAEILQVVYAEDLRSYLAKSLSKITLITFEELIFPDIEQEIVIFIGEKGENEKGIRIIELNDLDDIDSLEHDTGEFQKLRNVREKWTKYFLTAKENELIVKLRTDTRFQKLSDTALIYVGVTTGNNRYFSVTEDTVREYELQDIVHPLIGKSSHACSVYFTEADRNKNAEDGKAVYLIDFPDTAYDDTPISINYIFQKASREARIPDLNAG